MERNLLVIYAKCVKLNISYKIFVCIDILTASGSEAFSFLTVNENSKKLICRAFYAYRVWYNLDTRGV